MLRRENRRQGHGARQIRGRSEHIGDRVHCQQNSDTFERQIRGGEHRYHRKDAASGNTWNRERREHDGHNDRRELRRRQRDAKQTCQKNHADGLGDGRAKVKNGDGERQHHTGSRW